MADDGVRQYLKEYMRTMCLLKPIDYLVSFLFALVVVGLLAVFGKI